MKKESLIIMLIVACIVLAFALPGLLGGIDDYDLSNNMFDDCFNNG